VGGGMVTQDLPGRQALRGLELESPEIAHVSAQERHERHGHYPALFLLEKQPALASRLERALFDLGFEVLHLNDREALPYALLDTVRTAQRIGAVSIYSGEALDAKTKHLLASEMKHLLVDLSPKNENSDEDVFRRALALADSLRLAKPVKIKKEAD